MRFLLVAAALVAIALVGVVALNRLPEESDAAAGESTEPEDSLALPWDSSQPRPRDRPIPDVAGIWVEGDDSTTGFQIDQDGHSVDFRRWGILPNGSQFESTGRGTIDAELATIYYRTTFQTGIDSEGDCSGVLSADGREMQLDCRDSLLGDFAIVAARP